MRFILNIRVQLPGDWPKERRDEMVRIEQEAAIEHMRAGILRRVFRIPGQWGNFSIWEAESLEKLHEHLVEMPAFPWMTVNITPVIEPEVEKLYAERYGPKPPI